MTNLHVVRIGSCGTVGHYVADDQQSFERGTRVVCRTQRGLEVGEVLACGVGTVEAEEVDGDLVRPLDHQDESRLAQQARQRDQAIDLCQTLLDQAAAPTVIVDAVYPLDAQHICFYVLGELDQSLTGVARQLGTQLDVNVLFRPVAEEESSGCGSGGCGSGGGCSTGSCSTCPAAGSCSK
jgi:cell fate regulator YaaT (PSP1 superfamily)